MSSSSAHTVTPVEAAQPHTHLHDEHHSPYLAHHFDSMEVQHNSAKLGMWLFLSTEILLFSGLFVAYAVWRGLHPDMFAQASYMLDLRMGGFNTVVLIGSSLTMALAVRAAQINHRGWLKINLLLTLGMAGIFLVVKYFEYMHKFHLGIFPGKWFDPNLASPEVQAYLLNAQGNKLENVRTFFSIYYLMTGLHGLHVIFGMGAIIWLVFRAFKNTFNSEYYYPVEVVGLYWHLVDLIWIFLFPLLYLINRSH